VPVKLPPFDRLLSALRPTLPNVALQVSSTAAGYLEGPGFNPRHGEWLRGQELYACHPFILVRYFLFLLFFTRIPVLFYFSFFSYLSLQNE
jgi:hypothetical protein